MQAITLTLAATAAFTLVACGGSSSDDSNQTGGPHPVEVSINARADAALVLNGRAVDIDVTANDSYNGSGSLQLEIVEFDEIYGQLEVSDLMVTFTPAEGFWGETSFTYKLSDGAVSDEAEVTVTSAQQLTIAGQVAGSSLQKAMVSIDYGDETFTTVADEYGQYEIELLFAKSASDELLRLQVTGSEDNQQSYVTFSSILGDFAQLKAQAGDNFILTRAANHAVQVTPISTALDILAHANANAELNYANLVDAQVSVNPDLLIEMAAVIALLVDHSGYEVPPTFATIEALLLNRSAYNILLQSAAQNGDLEPAIAAMLADERVTPLLEENQLVGDYFLNLMGSNVIGYQATDSWHFYDNGVIDITNNTIGLAHYIVTTRDWNIEGNRLTVSPAIYPVVLNIMPTQVTTILYNQGYEHIDILIAYLFSGEDRNVLERRIELNDINVLNVNEHGVHLSYTYSLFYVGFEFEYEGVSYEMPDVVIEEYRANRLLVSYASMKKRDGQFEIAETTPWVLPVIATSVKDNQTLAPSDIIRFDFDSATSGAFYGEFTNARGDWALSADGMTLVLSYSLGTQDITTTLEVASFAGVKTSAIVRHQVSGEGRLIFDTIAYLRRVAAYTPQSNQLLTHADDEFFARFLSSPMATWSGNLPPTDSLGSTWYLRSNGRVATVNRYCGSQMVSAQQSCAEEDTRFQLGPDSNSFVWEFNGSDALDINRLATSNALTTYTALDFDEVTQSMNIMEYWPQSGHIQGSPSDYALERWPRIKVWTRISHIDFLVGTESAAGTESYRIMHSTQQMNLDDGLSH
ncbi:MAG: hypothetical protein JJU03_01975 [Idiomarina sp.]|nr:hypothetical protein [Idiomarina sp.]